jgi:hypothetical protein
MPMPYPTKVLVVLTGIFVWLGSLYLGMHTGCEAYEQTPAISDFHHFALPAYNGHEGKFQFLLGPTLTSLFLGMAGLSISERSIQKVRWMKIYLLSSFILRSALVGLGGILFLGITYSNSHYAIMATKRLQWVPDVSHQDSVAKFCNLVTG